MYFHDSRDSEYSNIQELLTAQKQDENDEDSSLEVSFENKESFVSKLKDQKNLSKSTKKMLELLCNETGFLVRDFMNNI